MKKPFLCGGKRQTLLFSFTAIRGQAADFLWQIAKGPRSLNKLSHGCFVLVKLLGPQRRFPLLIFLAIKTCLKLVVGNAFDFLLPLCFLVGLGNFWTPIKGTWQTFLPRIRTLLGLELFVLVSDRFSKLIEPCLLTFPFLHILLHLL